jgi:hypothetical protein
MRHLDLFGRKVPLPKSRSGRIALGSALCAGGLVGFLPVVGFWMLPLGIGVLAVDVPPVQRFSDRVGRWLRNRRRHRDKPAGRLAGPRQDDEAPAG